MATKQKKTPPIQVYADDDLREWLEIRADRDGRSNSKQVEFYLKEARARESVSRSRKGK